MKKILVLAILSLFVLAACNGGNPADKVATEVTKQTIKIGASIPLTGDTAFIGIANKNGMSMALEETKAKSTKYNYELIFEDDKLDPKTTTTAVNKLISIDGVQVVTSISSGTGNAAAPIASANNVVHFGIASDANIATLNKNSFIHWTSPEEEAKAWVNEAEKRGVKKLAILGVQQQGEVAIMDAVKEATTGTSVDVVFDETFEFGTTDFRTIIIKAKKAKPDMYMLLAFSPEIDNLHKQMKELGIKEELTSIEAFELSDKAEQFEGYWYVNAADPSETFVSKYKTKFGDDSMFASGNAYDVFNLLVQAFEDAGDGKTIPTTEQVAAQLKQIKDFPGALGPLTVGSDGIVKSGAVVRTIKDGKQVTLT
ncbi:hypothetical protein COV18_04115 [Candidatus Woesearchaeota archaeon CG10_big_fil_rev_8_21_14_0_10_37_12]|nr:MAG: hypothetical protein COV18_04115 [Candidatus Woesearchaeota archaeon CG10_big_fil_rev_8_21_14_0_10_37_12]